MKRHVVAGLCLVLLLSLTAAGAPPPEMDYQGKILVNDIPLTGPGYFKYAISDAAGTGNYWAHDGTATGEPATFLTNECYNGVFSVLLGSDPMQDIDPDIFAVEGTDLVLRVWFSEDGITFNEMLPAQELVSAPYAINSDQVDGYDADELIAAATNAFTETDPVFGASDAAGITASDISNWDAAYGWGDHSTFGYLTSETDPIFGASAAAGITAGDIVNWNTAFGWGDHALAGYLTAESDPIWTASSNNFYTKGEAETRYVNVAGDTMTGTLVMNVGLNNDLIIGSAGRTIGIGNSTGVGIGNDRIALGREVTNFVDNSARIRGTFWMDGGTGLVARPVFGTGAWKTLSPLPPLDNVIYVATNGTPAGPGNIDRPFSTPQAGYDYAAATRTNGPAAVVIAAGRYPGLTMHAGNIHVLGHSRPQLDSLMITAPAKTILGKQRVENIIVEGVTTVAADLGEDVKFHNCRFQRGLVIYNSRVEVQDCYAVGSDGPAITVGNGSSVISEIAIYNSSMFNKDSSNPALLVNQNVYYFEVIGCEIANFDPTPGVLRAWAALEDQEISLHPNQPPHLYSHNVIRGPEANTGIPPAVYDSGAVTTPTITFVNNTVWGDVGVSSNMQFFANNIVYGMINNIGGPIGWAQAGVGTGTDPAGNTEHQIIYPQRFAVPAGRGFPAAWQD
ncbi:MAG: hypothetical protein KA248_11140 [Kiritimatiellae bacterium]|nr:hypothetical protein [Kiritimatiellia bacterium]